MTLNKYSLSFFVVVAANFTFFGALQEVELNCSGFSHTLFFVGKVVLSVRVEKSIPYLFVQQRTNTNKKQTNTNTITNYNFFSWFIFFSFVLFLFESAFFFFVANNLIISIIKNVVVIVITIFITVCLLKINKLHFFFFFDWVLYQIKKKIKMK